MKKVTIERIIKRADELMPGNTYSNDIKYKWLSDVDSRVADLIIRKSEEGRGFWFNGYDKDSAGNTELLIPEPYSDAYVHYIHSQIYFYNHDEARYQTSYSAYHAAFQNYAEHYNREHMPIGHTIKVF